jgi:hypothetical protein
MALMTAKYPGTCATSGEPFRKGDTIDYDKDTKRTVLIRSNSTTMKRYRKTDYAIARQPLSQQIA